MLTYYRPGTGRLHRLPAGRKTLLVLCLVLCVSLLPSTWWAAAAAGAVTLTAYAFSGLDKRMRELGRQVFSLRWILAITLLSQLFFLGPEPAVANTARVAAAVVISALLMLTTPVTALLDAIEHGLQPLRHVGLDPQRAALILTVTLTTIPVLARLAADVRDAQRARGASGSVRGYTIPLVVLASKHAFELGDALAARGVR